MPIETPCPQTEDIFWRSTGWWIWRARWSVWAASAPAPGSCFWKASTVGIHSSCRLRKRRLRCSKNFAGASVYTNHGQRVVAGQQLMQGVSDIFLGWQRTRGYDDIDRDFYVRQLRDWKGSAEPETMIPLGMTLYARLCGWTLAHAHARSGDRVAIASYLGRKRTFDQAIADFASAYADLNEQRLRSPKSRASNRQG